MSTRTVFAYTRVSSVGQNDGHGPERQLQEIQRFAKQRRWKIVGQFHDSHTGTEAERPEFTKMLVALKSNGTRTVIVERLDRFAREIGVQIALFATLQREGITLFEAATGRDVTAALEADPMSKAMLNIQACFHQAEKELLVQKLRKARDAEREEHGRCEGRAPFGTLDGEQEIVDLIRKLRRKPKGKKQRTLQEIADELNRLGTKTPSVMRGYKLRNYEKGNRGKDTGKWSLQTVWQILKREPESASAVASRPKK